ncbi:hypothetical protein BOSEA31B_11570 [Hyphomicrobiales bacterium]|nr:hypothetical protein BOSEA31B_11570 [Hyphomicrobiales bacterium]
MRAIRYDALGTISLLMHAKMYDSQA